MQEYYYKGKLILGVDHGYGNMKTAYRVFPSSVEKNPQFGTKLLEYKGEIYNIGGSHKEFKVEKIGDDDYYLLTLAALAEELHFRGKTEAVVHLAAGLPLYWVKEQKEEFQKYLFREEKVRFTYRNVSYQITFTGVSIFPQGFAALAKTLGEMKGMSMMADIGNGTMNVMFLDNGKPIPGKFYTEQYGTYQCMKSARNELIKMCKREVPDNIVEEVIRKGTADIPEQYINAIAEVAKNYVEQVFSKLREYGYNEDLMKLYVIGGGGCLVENFADYDKKRIIINQDICATAKGYEYLGKIYLATHKKEFGLG